MGAWRTRTATGHPPRPCPASPRHLGDPERAPGHHRTPPVPTGEAPQERRDPGSARCRGTAPSAGAASCATTAPAAPSATSSPATVTTEASATCWRASGLSAGRDLGWLGGLLRPGTRNILGRAHVPVEEVGETPGSLPEEGAGFGVVLGFPVAGPCPNPWGRVPFYGAVSPSPRPHRGPGALRRPLHPHRNWVRAARTRLRPRRLSGLAPGGGTHTRGGLQQGCPCFWGRNPPSAIPLWGHALIPSPPAAVIRGYRLRTGGFGAGEGFFVFFLGGGRTLIASPS